MNRNLRVCPVCSSSRSTPSWRTALKASANSPSAMFNFDICSFRCIYLSFLRIIFTFSCFFSIHVRSIGGRGGGGGGGVLCYFILFQGMPQKKESSPPPEQLLGRPSNTLKMGIVGLPNVG